MAAEFTKTEVKNLSVDSLRELLSPLFSNDLGEMSKSQIQALVDKNWDYIDMELNSPIEGEPDEESPVEEEPDVNFDLSRPNPRTDLYTGSMPGE